MAVSGVTPEKVREALDELLGSQGISRSPQISDLLRYVVEKTLAGDGASIKAYSIAVDVLGRPADFDPQSDPIVRVQARRLRSLLDEYYASGRNQSGIEIHLPLGRYVPEFHLSRASIAGRAVQPGAERVAGASGTALSDQNPPDRSGRGVTPTGRRELRRFYANVLLGFAFTIIGVALTVAVLRGLGLAPTAAPVPSTPVVSVADFDNLTGDPVLDDDVHRVGLKLAAALGKFDTLSVTPDGAPLTIRGTVEENRGQFQIKILLVQGNGILWSTTQLAPTGFTDTEALSRAVDSLAAQMGNAAGPLHAAGRAWLKVQTAPIQAPTLYLCQLEYMAWRDSRMLSDADKALDCFNILIAAQPDSSAALAGWAGVDAWRESYLARAGADLVDDLALPTQRAARAVLLAPDDSFVHEQQALVLGRQGSMDAALGAIAKAMELNPASLDAMGVAGIVTWLSGDFAKGSALGEAAIDGLLSPPPWYYMTRAFETLRQKRYFDAVAAGLALAAGDEEFGPAIVLAAAQRAGRVDLVDRYRPIIMNNPRFQESGILPRLAVLIKPPILIERLRDGLTVAGIPSNALVGPFNADGSAR